MIGYGGCDRLSIESSIATAASISFTAAAVSPAACAAAAAASRACIVRICCTNGCWPGTRARSIISAALAFAVAASFRLRRGHHLEMQLHHHEIARWRDERQRRHVIPRFGFDDEAGERVEVAVEDAIGQREDRPAAHVARLEVLRVGRGLAVGDRRVLRGEEIDRLLRILVAAELKVVVGEIVERMKSRSVSGSFAAFTSSSEICHAFSLVVAASSQ